LGTYEQVSPGLPGSSDFNQYGHGEKILADTDGLPYCHRQYVIENVGIERNEFVNVTANDKECRLPA
jgi:hypothetical protein